MRSPYTPGRAPRILAGRDDELNDAREELNAIARFAEFPGRIRVATGPRGLGKTSLLKAVADQAREFGFVVAWATSRPDASLIGSLVHQLTEGLDAIGVSTTKRGRLRDRIREVSVEVGAGPVKGGAKIDTGRHVEAEVPPTDAFRGLIAEAARAARERGSAGLCLIIDEIQDSPPSDLRTLAYSWQELQNSPDEPAAAAYAAGLPNAAQVLTGVVTFSERFAFRPLERLRPTAARLAISEPAAELEVTWEVAAVTEASRRADGYPYLLQLYGDVTWRRRDPSPGDVITVVDLDAAESGVARELASMYESRWARASEGERRLLGAMAAGGDGPVARAEIAARLQVDARTLSTPRDRLIAKGLIESSGRGSLRFTIPGFAGFIRSQQQLN